nr:putative RNA-directed DNA polymerase, eukaryota, reverse transcriptase zinc-binding domain protein [Tanacetum cinerariifolium]
MESKRGGTNGLLKKIDRTMANLEFNMSFVGSSALFQPYRISDHSSAIIIITTTSVLKPRPFKFSNVVVKMPINPLRKLLYDQANTIEKVKRLRHDLDEDALLDEERFLKQKAKVKWLNSSDANSAYFHKVVKSHASKNRIDSEAWDIIAQNVCNAVKGFFVNGVLLKELNHTIIALISKVTTPLKINDYRLISCCNVLFKCISKIISNRIKDSLMDLVSLNQFAFVPGRRISDNIMLTQELMHNYHLDRGPPRCASKVDIQKAYDIVDWVFLKDVLVGFGFHPRMIGWIMECVSSTSFSISINGYLHGYFKGKRGLRQGDPMSPYLFTLVMEVLTLMLHRRVSLFEIFTYHRYCSYLNIINLCFADDLFLFAHGDANFARVIMDSLEEFKNALGLTSSLPKSTA